MKSCTPLSSLPSAFEQVDAAMERFLRRQPAFPLAVAFSGGADSTALLLACVERWPGKVQAWHVNHGLQAAAEEFEAHCVRICAQWRVPLRVRCINASHVPGESPEDAARCHRYRCFDEWAQADRDLGKTSSLSVSAGQVEIESVRSVLIAQHADDQIETILLALSRGAGLPGLAAMPAQWQRAGVHYYRPFLSVPGAILRAWLRQRGHSWIEDPSNESLQYTRNRIRKTLLPTLEAEFPYFRTTFARSAAHAAQAQQVLQEVASDDLIGCGVPPQIKALQALSAARQANALRHWLQLSHHQIPSSAQMSALLAQVAACRTRGHQIQIKVGHGFVVRRGAVIDWCAELDAVRMDRRGDS